MLLILLLACNVESLVECRDTTYIYELAGGETAFSCRKDQEMTIHTEDGYWAGGTRYTVECVCRSK